MAYSYSLIIPVYQAKKYIAQCLDSIYRQISAAVQVILVDDGSTDGSGDICDEYAARYPHTEVLHQANQGVACARNAGLAAAKGDYLLWVDPDDWVAERWFSQVDRVARAYAPDVIVFDSLRVGNGTKRKERYGRPEGFVAKELFCADLARDIRMLSGFTNKAIRRELFSGITFDASLAILEDYDVIFSVMHRAQRVYYIRDLLYFYRQHDDSLLHQYAPEKSFQCVQLALRRREALEAQYQQAADVGVAVQAFLYCRASAYDARYRQDCEPYRYCRRLLRQRMRAILCDRQVPLAWKVKLALMDRGLLNGIVKIKTRLHGLRWRP